MSLTLIIIAITVIISIAAFNNSSITNNLILWPSRMNTVGEYYRLLTSGFIHADWSHLFFNMFTFYLLGEEVEGVFALAGKRGLFPVLYLTGIVVASLPSFIKNRNNSYYRSLGASGGVSAILFAGVYLFPWGSIRIMFIPIDIPGIVFGVLYLIYCAYMDKRGGTNINHGAHFWGAIYGLLFMVLIDPSHGQDFMQQLIYHRF